MSTMVMKVQALIGNVDQIVRNMSSYMQFDSHHNPLWHAPLPCHFRDGPFEKDKRCSCGKE